MATVAAEEAKDEINLSVIPTDDAKEVGVNDVFWEVLEKDNKEKGIGEIREGSTRF